MTARELHAFLQSSTPPRLIHVLPPEVFAATRIPGSQNACVYEMTCIDQVRALVPDLSAPIVVYGAGEGSEDAATAVEKLRAAGYTQVQPFDGGLAEWKAAGLPLAGDGHLPQPPVPDGTFRLDTAKSVIRRTGRNLFNHHSGTVRLASGEIVLRAGQLASARFTIAMDSIANEDLADPTLNAMLIAHLHSADFFDVAHHPTAQFTAGAAEKIATCTDGTPNHLLRGTFTLRGISRPLDCHRPPAMPCGLPAAGYVAPLHSPCSSPRPGTASASPARASSNSTAPTTAATTAPANSSASSANTSSTTSSISMSKSTRSGRAKASDEFRLNGNVDFV